MMSQTRRATHAPAACRGGERRQHGVLQSVGGKQEAMPLRVNAAIVPSQPLEPEQGAAQAGRCTIFVRSVIHCDRRPSYPRSRDCSMNWAVTGK